VDGGLVVVGFVVALIEDCFTCDCSRCSSRSFDVVVDSMGISSFVVASATVFFVEESILLFRRDEDDVDDV
jgi:hypothetical protein